jgi:hypothetical protein
MKSLRVILGIVALTTSFGGAFASMVFSPQVGYKFVSGGSPVCQPHSGCDTTGTITCQLGDGSILREGVGSTCGQALKMRE